MPDANSRYDVEVIVTDVTPGQDKRVEFDTAWRAVNYGMLVGIEALLGEGTIEWGKATAAALGQEVPSLEAIQGAAKPKTK